jgi:hypothetical protein
MVPILRPSNGAPIMLLLLLLLFLLPLLLLLLSCTGPSGQ